MTRKLEIFMSMLKLKFSIILMLSSIYLFVNLMIGTSQIQHLGVLCYYQVFLSSRRMAEKLWLEGILKPIQFQSPCYRQGCRALDQAGQVPSLFFCSFFRICFPIYVFLYMLANSDWRSPMFLLIQSKLLLLLWSHKNDQYCNDLLPACS